MKKLLKRFILSALVSLALVVVAGCNDNPTSTKPAVTVGVSEVKGNPDKYLGNIKVTGKAGNVFPEDGVVEIADAKACCAVYLFVPFTKAQNEKFNTESLYQGTFPEIGADISVTGVLSKNDKGYVLEVSSIQSGDATLITKI